MSDNFFNNSGDEGNELDIGKIFRLLLMQSKLIISILVIAFVIAYLNYSLSTKKYSIYSLLQYESFNQNIFDPSSTLQMASSGPSSDINNLAQLYESRTNYLRLIKDLSLNISTNDLSEEENIDLEIISDNSNHNESYILTIDFSKNGFSILDKDKNVIQTSEYGKQVLYDDLKITIKAPDLKEYRPIDIYYTNPESMYSSLKNQINVSTNTSRNSFFRNEGLITISYISDDIEKGKKIVNYANDIFLNQRIYDDNEKSRKAIKFIDENIKSIEKSVELNKSKLKKFREKNKSIDVSLEIEVVIQKIQSLDEALSSIDIELSKAQELYTINNPVYLNLLNKKNLINKQKDEVLSEIEMMPKEQQEYIDLFNNLEISQSLYEELESRRLGFSIMQASTIGDIRVIDDAYVVSLVSPRLISIFIIMFAALAIGCFIAIIRGLYFLPLSNPAELFDNNINIPIIGVIPKVDDIEINKDDERLSTSIEALIVSINSIQDSQPDKNIITITSPSPSNGKSTISMKLAEGLSQINKKTLLVDNDLKRGNIAKIYNVRSISENTFNSIDKTSINKYEIHDNLYFIPRVKGLNNSFRFLYSYSYKDKIKFFRDYFDYIIFDTGPILSVADSSILIEQSDINVLVARHGLSRVNEIKQSIDNFKQINKNIDGIVYNAYSKPKSYYGYYGLYGNYAYQYYAEKYLYTTYDYKKED